MKLEDLGVEPITPERRHELWRQSKPGAAARVGDIPQAHVLLVAYELCVRQLEAGSKPVTVARERRLETKTRKLAAIRALAEAERKPIGGGWVGIPHDDILEILDGSE